MYVREERAAERVCMYEKGRERECVCMRDGVEREHVCVYERGRE